MDTGLPAIHVRRGKRNKPRIVPVHPELHSALASSLQFGNIVQGDRLIKASRSTADRCGYGRPRPGGGGGCYTAWAAYFQSYAEALIRTASAGERYPDQLPVALAGAFFDTDDTDLP